VTEHAELLSGDIEAGDDIVVDQLVGLRKLWLMTRKPRLFTQAVVWRGWWR
jgi:hypothetical protein